MAAKTILLKSNPGGPLLEEYVANAALSPGHVLYILSTGKVAVHATAGGKVYPLIALEDRTQGKTVTDAYAAGEQVSCAFLSGGEEFLGRAKDGENIAIGDYLESGAAGELRKAVADTSAGTIVVGSLGFVAMQACDMSGSAGVDPSPLFRVKAI